LLLTENHSVEPFELSRRVLVFEPDEPSAGFIFYPGGKVEYTAYIPLMSALAEEGILCILIKMPCNLAVLDMNAAKGLTEKYPDIDDWYIGGHSLGGSMAASYASKNSPEIDGLILLGSYSTAKLSIPVLSVYGSEDGVMNREKYAKYKPNIELALTENIIEGGNHALFGSYGTQKGDGMPTISDKEQLNLTVQIIIEFIN
jgi:dienelactone hydrolase